jgi:hypothetical protein
MHQHADGLADPLGIGLVLRNHDQSQGAGPEDAS